MVHSSVQATSVVHCDKDDCAISLKSSAVFRITQHIIIEHAGAANECRYVIYQTEKETTCTMARAARRILQRVTRSMNTAEALTS